MYDHPHQWGSKRTGPDLARVGAKYSDVWHVAHLANPREFVKGSVMPGYAFLLDKRLDTKHLSGALTAMRRVGVPYTDAQIDSAEQDASRQADVNSDYEDELIASYGDTIQIRDFDGQPNQLTEMDALVAYLQMLGTLVDFDAFDVKENNR
jgi:cytochrome c oxidase cbb3-type subunit 2